MTHLKSSPFSVILDTPMTEKSNIDMEESSAHCNEIVHLARLALAGRRQDIQMYIRRLSRNLKALTPQASEQLGELLRELPSLDSPLRNETATAIPIDADSRLKLIRVENPVFLDVQPIWGDSVKIPLNQVIQEQANIKSLLAARLDPTKSIIFTGPPGVGKTLAARWIAQKLKRPLLTLDLSAVMSSFLGRTGTNLRFVLDYAKSIDCVFLMDEFDAIAKRRDDSAEVGELKRLVTVLLQEIDDWPSTGILIAATNHSNLLDPAVWRRFEMTVKFPMPTQEQVSQSVKTLIQGYDTKGTTLLTALTTSLSGVSFSDIQREINRLKRESVVYSKPVEECAQALLKVRAKALNKEARIKLAAQLCDAGLSQRQAHEITGVSRDTIRKQAK